MIRNVNREVAIERIQHIIDGAIDEFKEGTMTPYQAIEEIESSLVEIQEFIKNNL